jgi:putative acetyltransferase
MQIRPYRDENSVAIWNIFDRAVHTTASAHYSEEQLNAWAPAELDAAMLTKWGTHRAAAETLIAVEDDQVAGFADLVGGTYLDMLYVDPRFGRQGIGSALISSIIDLAKAADASHLTTDASLTARPVFERNGFVVIEQRAPVHNGVRFTNFRMNRTL